jgi:hypothetical protein
MSRRRKVNHVRIDFGLIRYGCSCGWRFRIENLKGKSDAALEAEGEEAFDRHADEG